MDLAEIYEASRSRVKKQSAIEEAIVRFTPDFLEASEIVAAILVGLRNRYEDNLGADLEHDFKGLTDLLNKLDDEWPENIRERYEELFKGQRVNDE